MAINFLIQTINGCPVHDFSFHLIEAIHQQNWYYQENVYNYKKSESIQDELNSLISSKGSLIPVGSLQFVFDFIKNGLHLPTEFIVPLNIPHTLRTKEYLGRNVWQLPKEELQFSKPMFLKSATKYKSFTDVLSVIDAIPNDDYFVSEVVDFQSEWRAFVYQNQLLDVRNYLGRFDLFPNIDKIKKMVKSFANSPIAYTLDIGYIEGDWYIVEVHPFVSCGLYGFNNAKILPLMIRDGFQFFLEQSSNSTKEE